MAGDINFGIAGIWQFVLFWASRVSVNLLRMDRYSTLFVKYAYPQIVVRSGCRDFVSTIYVEKPAVFAFSAEKFLSGRPPGDDDGEEDAAENKSSFD